MDYEEWMKMSPEEREKKVKEIEEEARKALEKLTPEERKQAEEGAEKLLEEYTRKQQDLMDRVQKVMEESKAEKPAPKFCTNCGSPVSGGKFCTNCGNPL